MVITRATIEDLPHIVAIYAADETGGHGDAWTEDTAEAYCASFRRITANPDYELYTVRKSGNVVATFMLHFCETLVGQGGTGCELHSVSVLPEMRGRGLGAAMLRFAEAQAKLRGARVLRLVSNKKRVDAHRFYRREDYAETHLAFAKRL